MRFCALDTVHHTAYYTSHCILYITLHKTNLKASCQMHFIACFQVRSEVHSGFWTPLVLLRLLRLCLAFSTMPYHRNSRRCSSCYRLPIGALLAYAAMAIVLCDSNSKNHLFRYHLSISAALAQSSLAIGPLNHNSRHHSSCYHWPISASLAHASLATAPQYHISRHPLSYYDFSSEHFSGHRFPGHCFSSHHFNSTTFQQQPT
jgi:hypothetical protein